MTTINQIYPFGETAATANILDNAGYLADAQRLSGHQPGIGRQELENAVLRNLSRFCHGLAEFIAERYEPGVVDDGDASKIIAGMTAAIEAVAAGVFSTVSLATIEAPGIIQLATHEMAIAGLDDQDAVTSEAMGMAIIGAVRAYTRQQYAAQVLRNGVSGAQAVDLDQNQALAIIATGAITMSAPTQMVAGKTCMLFLYAASAQTVSWDTTWHGTSLAILPTSLAAGKLLMITAMCVTTPAGTYMVPVGMVQEA